MVPMKTKLWLLLLLIFCFFSSVNARASDLEKDQQIISIMSSDQFVNALFYYQFEDHQYPLRIIHNPKGEMLWGNDLLTPTSLSLMLIADTPIPLAHHLEDLVLELRGSYEGCYFSLKQENPERDWDLIWPVYIAKSVNDSINDEMVQNTFNSASFVNRVIYYDLNNKYYQVRLLHNPEGQNFSASKRFRLEPHDSLRSFSISWNKKYAIAVDKKAPKALIDHLSTFLRHLSYWDWYFNFSLENGTYVEYWIQSGNMTTTYSLDTWFNFTESFGQD